MKLITCAVTVLVTFFISIESAVGQINITNALAKDIGQAYGFYVGQTYSLNAISQKYPSMSNLVLIAGKEFSANFGSSINGMDAIMMEYGKNEWHQIKITLTKQIESSVNIDNITEAQALQFVNLVRQRAKGNIESPIIETMLLFKSDYKEHPEKEFLDGFTYRYSTEGTGKAKGVKFSIDLPKTWLAKDGNRPNVVKKFVSENGKGLELLIILIKEVPLMPNEKVTQKDVEDLLNPKDIREFLPDGSNYLKSGKLKLENLPGFWIYYNMQSNRLRNTIDMETIMYAIFYKNKMIQLQGQVTTSVNGKNINRGGFKKYENLFDLIANSLVISNMYQ